MARYDVYSNPSGGYVLDVQADLLDELKTRIVIPLILKRWLPSPRSGSIRASRLKARNMFWLHSLCRQFRCPY
ncbi:CcdB family protein [Ochrobactrum sp. SSR]|nr:CcdB family protein [Ochrobactrum sp. SSR]